MYFKFSFVFIAIILNISGLNFQQISANSNNCLCDLTLNYCDIGCCCDTTDCTSEDLKAFKCSEKQENLNDPILNACIPKNILYTSNTPYVIKLGASLFCVEYKDIQLPNNYNITTEELKNQVESIHPIDSISILEFNINNQKEYFDVTDAVWTINKENTISYLQTPKKSDRAPLHYMKNKKFEYLIEDSPILNTIFMNEIKAYQDLKIISQPRALENCSNDYYKTCQNLTSLIIKCYLETQVDKCDELVKNNVFYISSYEIIIEYLNPFGITNATINFNFKEKINKVDKYIQNIKVEFKSSINGIEISGRPGYVKGKPVIAGFYSESNGNTTSEIPSNRNEMFTIFKSSMICNQNSTSRLPINFGINTFSECFLEVEKLSDLKDTCENLANEVKQIILGNSFRPNYVASYGDVLSFDDLENWIKIDEKFEDIISKINTCDSISSKLSIEIVYAKVGNAINPQNKIIKVLYRWLSTNVKLKCFNKICTDRINLITSVTFVDISLESKLEQAKIFKSKGVVPNSFFEPLLSSSSKLLNYNNYNIFIIILLFFLHDF